MTSLSALIHSRAIVLRVVSPYLKIAAALLLCFCVRPFTGMAEEGEFSDKRIAAIYINVRDIFEGSSLPALYRAANKLKVKTRQHIIEQELRFKVGDVIDSFTLRESERVLRALNYLRQVEIRPVVRGSEVHIFVEVQDTWTLIPQISYSSGDGRNSRSIGLQDSDLWGYGKRLEVAYQQEDQADSIEAVWDDRRVMGSPHELLAGFFDRSDGERYLLNTGRPFRSLLDKQAWVLQTEFADTLGRLYEAAEESFVFRQERTDLNLRYTQARGNPELETRRYSFGYRYLRSHFSEATAEDLDIIGIDPAELDQDPDRLAADRTFSGPLIAFTRIEPEFLSLNYIDRFERVADYNLGLSYAMLLHFAPAALGSNDSALLTAGNISRGFAPSEREMLRGEIGFSARYGSGDLDNSLLRAEGKYYNVLGPRYLYGLPLGKHTLAASAFIDYGFDLDDDRQLRVGGDNALRGYEARSFVGDKRLALNLEDRLHLVDDLYQLISLGAAVFFDIGGASDQNLGELIGNSIYSDVGLGLRLSFPRSSGGQVLRLDVALPLRDGLDGSGQFEPRILLSGGQLFSAFLRSERLGAERASLAVGFDR